MMLIMLSAGASELAIAEWASLFAEMGLGISKSLGDILGPCAFAICMGIGRVLFGKFSERMKLEKWLMFSFLLCVASYLLTSLSPNPYLSLVGCMLTGLSVAIMWPGTYSLGASHLPHGGTAMFAFFALAGDLGCTLGPLVIGSVSDYVIGGGKIFTGLFAGDAATVGLKSGIFVTTLFPLVAVFATLYLFLKSRKKKDISGNRL